MRPRDRNIGEELRSRLEYFEKKTNCLPGILDVKSREALVEQLLESIHRVKFPVVISQRPISPLRADPTNEIFDPMRAAILCQRQGASDEACWFVFFFVHFGKSLRTGWRLARDVYGGLGGPVWNWQRTSLNPQSFREWLAQNQGALKDPKNPRRFGNHRKYESLDARSPQGTGAVVESYVRWVTHYGTHMALIKEAQMRSGTPRETFHYLYKSMGAVSRFGRTARFDYLTMLGKLSLAPIEPGSTYMEGATGPFSGACLLFFGKEDPHASRLTMDKLVVDLGAALGVGMQVMEDALCNWQKSPKEFIPFRG